MQLRRITLSKAQKDAIKKYLKKEHKEEVEEQEENENEETEE